MSGGTLTDHRYDTGRLIDWAREIRHHLDTEWVEYTPEFKRKCIWLSKMMEDLSSVVYELDLVFSGDTGEDRGMPAVDEFNKKWFVGMGPSEGDLAMMKVYLENAITTIDKIWKKGE